jgi:peptidoglycan hydrolase CwlO-like protein
MQETEFSFSDMLFGALRKWRKVIVFAIVCAILVGAVAAITRVTDMNDPEQVESWQTEYDVAYGAYWAAIHEFDRQISANERLAAQAQISIERLNLQKTEYEAQLKDLDEQIKLYEARIKNYEASIASLEHEKERLEYYLNYRKEHNANNLLMKIDPYSVNIHDTYIRVDAEYKINPDLTYQDTNPTTEILQTYQLLVNNTGFYQKMISGLNLKTEVRYITDLISVSIYGENSIRIRVMSDNAEWAKNVCDYISNAILNEHDRVQASIAVHKLEKYESRSYTTVDTGIYSTQYNYNQEVLNYEASIRNVDASILNTDASIRSINADIRSLKQRIEEINLTLANMPLNIKELEESIADYNVDNFEFRTEQLELLKKPEPEYGGYTPVSVITGFVKFAIIGGVVSAIIAFAYFAVVAIMKGKVLSSKAVSEAVNVDFFGFWTQIDRETKNKRKKAFAFVDEWIDNASGCTVKGMTPETAAELVVSNISVACAESKKVMLCGGASKEVIAEVANAVKAQLTDVEVICGGTIGLDPVVVRGVAECDSIVLVEQLDESSLAAAVQLKERAQTMNKHVLGVVVHN